MYIDAESIITAAKLLGALGTIAGLVVAAYKFVDSNRKQTARIQAIQKEQTILCYGIMACLKGLKEQGCNGPVSEALNKIEKHLNQAAHDDEVA